jgi:RimJ/RimL family protein N-acetyltransferase
MPVVARAGLLETRRLALRELQLDDVGDLELYRRDSRYAEFQPSAKTRRVDVERFVRLAVAERFRRPRLEFHWAIEDRAGVGNCIGLVAIRLLGAGAGEIGFEIAPDRWGYGYAGEAVEAVIRERAFSDLGLGKLWAQCLAENVPSRCLLLRRGFRLTRIFPACHYLRGGWLDRCLYLRLAAEAGK